MKAQEVERDSEDPPPKDTGAGDAGPLIQSLSVGLTVLEAVAKDSRGVGVTELAGRLGMTKSRVFRQLHTLTHEGFVEQAPDTGRYRVGPRFLALISSNQAQLSFIEAARESMEALRRKSGHTVAIARVLNESEVTVVDVVPGTQSVQIVFRAGTTFALHASAHGKLALAFGPPTLLKKVVRRKLKAYTRHTITDPNQLSAEIEQVRRQGWSMAAEEAYSGVNAIGAPIFGPGGRFEGSICITASIDAVPLEPNTFFIEPVVEAARQISRRLGWIQ
jgi:DNA-binding IclR family transcriptional regulator